MGDDMTNEHRNDPIQHIGNTIMVVMMEVDPEHEEEFNKWYNEEHLVERLEIPGYISARRFKLEDGIGVLKYLCIWELEDGSALTSKEYNAQQERPSELRDLAHSYITKRARGLYHQIYPETGSFEDHTGFHTESA